jgi:hypothetical protein
VQKSHPMGCLGREGTMRTPSVEKLTASTTSGTQRSMTCTPG